MDCEKCGAEVTEAADTCPECGEPMATETAETAETTEAVETTGLAADAPADEAAEPDATEPTDSDEDGDEKPGAINKKAATIAGIALGVLVALVLVALFVPIGGTTLIGRMSVANDPASAAKRMLAAYAAYDAAGILATTNSSAMPAADRKTFEAEAAKAKERAKGKAGVKDIKIGTVTIDPKDPTKATVEVTGAWLQDPEKGDYAERTDQLPVIQQEGTWVVQIF